MKSKIHVETFNLEKKRNGTLVKRKSENAVHTRKKGCETKGYKLRGLLLAGKPYQ